MTKDKPPAGEMTDAEREAQRLRTALVRAIREEAESTAFWTGRDRYCDAVLDAIETVPREAFIPKDLGLGAAYANRPQPIGLGQTISQPYIVALMTDLLDLKPTDRVLEVGSGSGYQAAILASIAAEVYSIERHAELAEHARTALAQAGFDNVHIACADGALGWAEHAPFDAVMVTAAAAGPVPPALIEQLAPRGRLVIPLGPMHGPQMLTLGMKDEHGKFHSRPILPVAFVPLVSKGFSGLENQREYL